MSAKEIEKRPIPGFPGWLVTATCKIYAEGSDEPEAFDWPWCPLTVDVGGAVGEVAAMVHAAEAAASAFLTETEMAWIYQETGYLALNAKSREVRELAEHYKVSKWVISYCGKRLTSEFSITKAAEAVASGIVPDEMKLHEVKDADFEDYLTVLVEKYRSPSRGGNTKALHAHAIVIGGEKYRFQALGAKKWAYKGDKVNFSYVISSGGYRNLIKKSFFCTDKDNNIVFRGQRGFKTTLRSATQKAPASARERNS